MRENDSFMPGIAVLATGVALVASLFLSPDFAFATDTGSRSGSGSGPRVAVERAPPPTHLEAPDTLEPFGDPLPPQNLPSETAAPSCDCPGGREKSARPKFAGLNGGALDESDELAALASVHQALNTVGDGSAYVWARSNGRLSGMVRPTSSFRNSDGLVCRHLVVMLTTGRRTQKTESTACRLQGGRWQLGG